MLLCAVGQSPGDSYLRTAQWTLESLLVCDHCRFFFSYHDEPTVGIAQKERGFIGLEMKREGSMHLVPAPAVRLMKSRVTSELKVQSNLHARSLVTVYFPFHSLVNQEGSHGRYHNKQEGTESRSPRFQHLSNGMCR